MTIKPHYETYRYYGKTCTVKTGTMVECKFNGFGIETVLSYVAKATEEECVCKDGEINYSGKLFVTVIYEDAERKVCRAEKCIEFSQKTQERKCTPSSYAIPKYKIEKVNVKREGSGYCFTANVSAEFGVFAEDKAEYLDDGEGLVCKKAEKSFINVLTCEGNFEVDDDFECEGIGDVLCHSETANVTEVTADAESIKIGGDIILNITALKEENVTASYERLIPFKAEIPCDGANADMPVKADVTCKNANLSLTYNEEKNRCKIEVHTELHANSVAYKTEKIGVCADAYSTEYSTEKETETKTFTNLFDTFTVKERISGKAILSTALEGNIECAVSPRVEFEYKKEGVIEGGIFATVITTNKDGAHATSELSLPFSVATKSVESSFTECYGSVYSLTVRQKGNGEIEAEATFTARVNVYAEHDEKYVCELKTGEKYSEEKPAISVFIPSKNDDLFEVAKKLCKTPEEVERSNPSLKFPLTGEERIIVYNQRD